MAPLELGELRLDVGLQPGHDCVYGVTKLVVWHFWHYREGRRVSQAINRRNFKPDNELTATIR